MGENSKIEWTHHTFNPWRGCTKVSAGCAKCYAERGSVRNPGVLGVWGPKGTREVAREAYWQKPIRWNKEAMRAGERRRVFCASLADVFEGRETMPPEAWQAVEAARLRLMVLIALTLNLDWLLLTKRPENAREFFRGDVFRSEFPAKLMEMARGHVGAELFALDVAHKAIVEGCLPNVWVGTSVENQAAADERIPELLRVPAKVRYLSCEPLLGVVNLAGLFDGVPRPDWVIAGGESGPGARPMHPAWVRSLRDQCVAAGVPFFFKQWGEWAPVRWQGTMTKPGDLFMAPGGGGVKITAKGQMPANMDYPGLQLMRKVGKAKAGRELDGQLWDEFPAQPSPKASAGDLRSEVAV